MYGRRCLIVLLSAVLLTAPARAGILFGKKKAVKVEPAQRVPELIGLVKSSPDESKRSEAVDELRKHDPKQFPDLMPVLIEVLQSDPKPSVRAAALSALSKFRPVSQEVGLALEQALAKDTSMRVRLQARSALLHYHLAGYHSPKKDGPQLPPPDGKATVPPVSTSPPLVPAPPPVPTPMSGAQRLPVGPVNPVRVLPKPVKYSKPEAGPDLGSPY